MKIFLFCILIIFIPLYSFSIDVSAIAYVTTKSGLVLRDKPSTAGKKIMVLQRNQSVEILEKSTNIDKIENISSAWYKVKVFDYEGWVFGGFVTKISNISAAFANNRYDATLFSEETYKSNKLATIPYRSKVELVRNSSKVTFIDDQSFRYIRIRWKNFEGWVRDFELSFIEIPNYLPDYNKNNEPIYVKSRENYQKKMYVFGRTRKEIIQKLGKPILENKQDIANEYNESQIDSIYTLKYDGLEITIYAVSSNGKEFITKFSFTSNKIIKDDKFINGPITNVFKEFGIPHEDMNSYVSYSVGESYDYMNFFQSNNKVNRIELCTSVD